VGMDEGKRTVELNLGGRHYNIKTSLDDETTRRVVEILQEAFSQTSNRLGQEERFLLISLHLAYNMVFLERRLQDALKDTEG